MADNLLTGPQAMTPVVDISFEDAGFTPENLNVAYSFQPQGSFKFGRDFNTLESLQDGKGVLLDMKQPLDATEVFYPGIANVTPAAPNLVADDTADTLYATHALGTGQLETSVNDGPYADYAPINVGNVARAPGYFKIRTKAAAGRNPSLPASSPAFNIASSGPVVYHNSTFTAPNGTLLSAYDPEVGNSFDYLDGLWDIQEGKAQIAGVRPSSTQWVALTDGEHADGKLTGDMVMANNAQGQIWLRADAPSGSGLDLILIAMSPSLNGGTVDYLIDIYNIVNGAATKWIDATAGLQNNTPLASIAIEVDLVGTSLVLKMNGTTFVTTTIPSVQTNTKFGFGATSGVDDTLINNGVSMDNFKFTASA